MAGIGLNRRKKYVCYLNLAYRPGSFQVSTSKGLKMRVLLWLRDLTSNEKQVPSRNSKKNIRLGTQSSDINILHFPFCTIELRMKSGCVISNNF